MASIRHKKADHLPLFSVVRLRDIEDTVTGAEMWFTVLPREGMPDARAVLTKDTSEGGGIETAPPNRFHWTLSPEDLADLAVDYDYYWYCQYKEAVTGRLTTIDEGNLRLDA